MLGRGDEEAEVGAHQKAEDAERNQRERQLRERVIWNHLIFDDSIKE